MATVIRATSRAHVGTGQDTVFVHCRAGCKDVLVGGAAAPGALTQGQRLQKHPLGSTPAGFHAQHTAHSPRVPEGQAEQTGNSNPQGPAWVCNTPPPRGDTLHLVQLLMERPPFLGW